MHTNYASMQFVDAGKMSKFPLILLQEGIMSRLYQ